MASTDARPVPIKNTAFRVVFCILDNDGDLVTGAAGLDSEVSKDQGTYADCTNEATEIATSSGTYYLDLTSTEMNADCVAVIVKTSTTDAKTTVLVLYPQESGDIKVDLQSILATAVSSPATAGILDVNVKNIDNDAASASGTVTFPNATLASTTGAVGSVTGAVGSVTAAVTVGTNNDKTGYGLSSTQAFNLTGSITGNLSGTVGGVTGSVGSVLGNVGGNVTGSVGSVSGVTFPTNFGALGIAVGGAISEVEAVMGDVSVGSIGNDVIAAASLNPDVAIEIAAGVWGAATRTLTSGGGSAPTAAENAIAVWDLATVGHTTSGTFGAAMAAAGSAGDPWSTLLPGSYGAGTAGYLIGTTYANLLTGLSITVSSPITSDGGTITLRRGSDYLLAIGTQVPLVFTGLPYSLVGGTMTLKRTNGDTWACTVTGATTAYFERTNAQTTALVPNEAGEVVEFDVTLSGGQKVTPATARLVIQTEL
jgi:hypothetical protein